MAKAMSRLTQSTCTLQLPRMAQQDRFAQLLSQVARDVTRRQASEVCCGDLTLEQFQTMRAIERSERATIGSLSSEQGVDLSTMSRNVALLERNGYLVRTRSDEDARVVLARLTAKGKRALNTLACSEKDLLKDLFERLPATERPAVIRSLEVLRDCVTNVSVEGDACCAPPARKRAP